MFYVCLLLAAGVGLVGCRAVSAEERRGRRAYTVLMIGNSYTAQTSPMIDAWAAAHPEVTVEQTALTRGGWTLRAHLNHADEKPYADGTLGLNAMLAARAYDVITIQDNSTAAATISGRKPETFHDNATALVGHVRRQQAAHFDGHQPRILLFQTWARHRQWEKYDADYTPTRMHEEIRDNYARAARALDAEVIPVGDAFARFDAMEEKPSGIESLHEKDLSHPGPYGCALSALVFLQTIDQSAFDQAGVPQHEMLPAMSEAQRAAMLTLTGRGGSGR